MNALRPGGLYYRTDGTPVDSENNVLEDAPKRAPDTPPHLQPGALGGPTPEQRIGLAIAQAITDPKGVIDAHTPKAPAGTEPVEETELPNVSDLQEHLASITSIDEVKALQAQDDRKTAQPLYDARIAELEA